MKTLVLALSLFLAAPRAFAQDLSEGPGDIAARVHYERAVRADAGQHWEEAAREAQIALDAAPGGKFAEASRALLDRARNHGGAAQEPSSGVGPRIELVTSSTILGLVWGSLAAAALHSEARGTAALLMVGAGGGLATSLAATQGMRVKQSVPGFLNLGAAYGGYAALLVGGLGSSDPTPGAVLAGSVGGAALGLIASPFFTGGDAAAASEGVIYGGLLPLLIEGTFARSLDKNALLGTLLVGSTAGLIAGPLLNRSLNFSRGRWNLIGLGGGVGALFGGGLAVLAASDSQVGLGMITLGAVSGLGLTAWLTSEFGADEPRGTALLHLEGGRLSMGSAIASFGPVVHDRARGVMLRGFEATF